MKKQLSDSQRNNILSYLEGIPSGWKLTPVKGKRGYLKGWQNGTDREIIKQELFDKATAPEDCSPANLKAMCSVCHLRYDKQHHVESRKLNRGVK